MSFGSQKASSTPKKSQKEPTQITCPFTTQYSTNYCRASLQACCTNYCSGSSGDSLQTTEKQTSRHAEPTTAVCLQGIVYQPLQSKPPGMLYQLLKSKPPGMLWQLLQNDSSRDGLPTTTEWAFKGCSTNYFSMSLQECCTNSCRVSLQRCCSKHCSESQGMFYQLLQSKPPGMLYQLLQSGSPGMLFQILKSEPSGMLYQPLQSEPSRDAIPTTAEWTFKGWSANYCRVSLQGIVCQLLQSKPPEQSSVWLKYLENRASERKLAI